MTDPWPAAVPYSLWRYHQLAAADRPQVPMMGVEFAPSFLYAFAFGVVFIAVFAWTRFNETNDRSSSGIAVIDRTEVGDLGGANALHRAYFIYAGALLLLYVAMTFFGKLILQTAQAIPLAGISVDVSELKFDSPQWPLTLAFAFAGLAPMLPPLRIAEKWLRERAYRAVGIPVRIQQTTRNLVATLNEAARTAGPAAPGTALTALGAALNGYREELSGQIEASPWAGEFLASRRARRDELLNVGAELELLVDWAKSARGSWPGPEVSQHVRDVELAHVKEADDLLNEFRQRLHERDAISTPERNERANVYLLKTVERARRLRDELAALIAIFIERDPYDPDHPPRTKALAELLHETEPPSRAGTGPETGVLLCLAIVFLLYAVFTWRGLNPLLTTSAETSNPKAVLFTAALETLRVAAVVWLPLLAAFSLRQYLADNRDWVAPWRVDPARYLAQRGAAAALAVGAAAIGLGGVAMLWAFAIAENSARFNTLLLGGAGPFLLYYPTQALYSVGIVLVCLSAADDRANGKSGLATGVFGAILVFGLVALNRAFWLEDFRFCRIGGPYLTDMFSGDGCFKEYEGLNFLVLPALTFLAAAVFGRQPAPNGVRTGSGRVGPSVRRLGKVAAGAALFLALSAVGAGAKDVHVGFRDDVEPFSYRVDPDGQDKAAPPRHIGFLADLCRQIFEGSDYVVHPVPVTAANRFARLRQPGEGQGGGRIDLLCDPVTMRFSDAERGRLGIFSPIVFATGVSYFYRNPRTSDDLFIGYVRGSTAREVARRACMIDMFKILNAPDQQKGLYDRCELAWQVARARELALGTEAPAGPPGGAPPADPTSDPGPLDAQIREALQAATATRRPDPEADGDPYAPEDRAETALLDQAACLLRRHFGEAGSGTDAPPPGCEPRPAASLTRLAEELTDPDCIPQAKTGAQPEGTPAEKFRLKRPKVHFCVMESHTDLIEWFCGPASENRRLIYMGDREIILGKLDTWKRRKQDCNVERAEGAEDLTYEPYAFLISAADLELVQFVQRRVYEFFSHRALATNLFATYFPNRTMSPALAHLFLLNAVEDERAFAIPLPPAPAPPPPTTSPETAPPGTATSEAIP